MNKYEYLKNGLIVAACVAATFLFCLSASAQIYNFRWNNPTTLTPSFPAPNSSNRYGEIVSNVEFKSGPVTFIVDDDANDDSEKACFYYGYTTLSVEMRAYRFSTLKIGVVDGYIIKEIKFEESVERNIPLSYKGSGGTFKKGTWTSETSEQVTSIQFDVDNTLNLAFTSVTVEQQNDDTQNAIESIGIDRPENYEQWFTLQGVRLSSRPFTPGLYILRSKSGTRLQRIN